MEDVDLTQQNNDSPVELSGKEVSATLRQSLFQDVHVFFQVVNIETDKDIIRFGLDSIKKEKFSKFWIKAEKFHKIFKIFVWFKIKN